MKTLTQIVQEHVARNSALVNDTEKMIAEAQRNEARLQARFSADLSLAIFVRHYSDAVALAVQMLPEAVRPLYLKSSMAQIIAEWEDINREFDEQITPRS